MIYREHDIQTQIKNYLEYKGFWVMRLNSGAIRTAKGNLVRLAPRGTPDLLIFKRGVACGAEGCTCKDPMHLYFIEVKVPGNKLSFSQEQMIKELATFGVKTFVLHSLEEAQKVL